MKEHVRPGFAVFPRSPFHFDVTAAADARHKNHCRRVELVHITRVVARAGNHVMIGITEFLRRLEYPLYQFFIEGCMFDPPGLLHPDGCTVSFGNCLELFLQEFPRPEGMIVVPGPDVNGKVYTVGDNVP